MCTEKNCRFRPCSDFLDSSIYCKSITNNSYCQITEHLTTSQGGFSASTSMSNHLTSEEVFVSTSTTGYYDSHQSPSTYDRQLMSSNLVLAWERKNLDDILISYICKFFEYNLHSICLRCQWRISFENIPTSRRSFHFTVMCNSSSVLFKVTQLIQLII